MRTRPWKYFQLNARWFNEAEGVFSKQDLSTLFPEKWSLKQWEVNGGNIPQNYPVFVKPMWGENGQGIRLVNNKEEFKAVHDAVTASKIPYLVQEAATGGCEFELFSIADSHDRERPSIFSVTEVRNSAEAYPINSIHNPSTTYHDLTDLLSAQDRTEIWELFGEVGRFPISRLCVRADSVQDMVKGKFHIVEINLYAPMPIHLLDARYSGFRYWPAVRKCAIALARVTRSRDRQVKEKPVYVRTKLYWSKQPLFKHLADIWFR